MALRLVAIALRQVLRLALLFCRASRSKDVEILVLRQELDVLRRQNPRPKIRAEERLVLSVLQCPRPARERLSLLVTPDTLRRWHRELARRKWHAPHRIVSRGSIGLDAQLVVWRVARENLLWGYRRIQGELAKVGIKANAYAERFIRTVRGECLNRIMILGPRHLESVLGIYVDHYNRERPHRGLDLRSPNGWPPTPIDASSAIGRRDRLGGLLHEYYRKVA